MRKLNRIILINAANFDYAEFPVGGHTQVIGVNGHGKSTLLRTVLFFYLGTNEKAPYALHETKADFVSYYLGNPPSYLIYEVSRNDGEPAYHIAVSRPSGRIQFHFIDAPYQKDYFVDGNLVQPMDAVLDRLRGAHCKSESVSSYEEFNRRIYGVVPSPYAIFRPASKSSGQVGILPRIISGIFTVSQLDADKLKSALTCGVRQDSLTPELDLLQLKGHLQNFRRVNRAVNTYLRHEEDSDALVQLAEQQGNLLADRQRAIEDLVRMAGRLPLERESLSLQRSAIEQELTAARIQFENANDKLNEAIRILDNSFAIAKNSIEVGEKAETEYFQRQIARKRGELNKLPELEEEQRQAENEYKTLTAKYDDESQRKEALQSNIKQGWSDLSRRFEERNSVRERDLRQNLDRLEGERKKAQDFIEAELHQSKVSLEPHRKGVQYRRELLNKEYKAFAELKDPPELAQLRDGIKNYENKARNEQRLQESLRHDLKIAKMQHQANRVCLDRKAEDEQKELQAAINHRNESRLRLTAELDRFECSLARFYQTESPDTWEQAAKTVSREVLFQNAQLLGAEKSASKEGKSVWGIDFSTDQIPATAEVYDREQLADALQTIRRELGDLQDKVDAARERYLAESGDLEKNIAKASQALESQITTSVETRSQLLGEIIRLDNRRLTLESQSEENKSARNAKLSAEDVAIRVEEERLRNEEKLLEQQFLVRKTKISQDFDAQKLSIQSEATQKESDLSQEKEAAHGRYKEELDKIERAFQATLAKHGVDTKLISTVQQKATLASQEISRISKYQEEVIKYETLKKEHIDPLPSLRLERARLDESLAARKEEQTRLKGQHNQETTKLNACSKELDDALDELTQAEDIINQFKKDGRFMQELGYFERPDLVPAPFYRANAIKISADAARDAHQQAEAVSKEGNNKARKFLNWFDSETLARKVLGFSPIHEYFDWAIFVGSELKPFVQGHRIEAMKKIQTQEFEQLIRNISIKNADFREGVRQVNQTAASVAERLKENNFVDVLDSVELRVERVDNSLTRTLVQLEEFADLSFGPDRDLFGKRADRSQVDRAIETFEKLLQDIEGWRESRLVLTDYFEFSIRVSENGHDMGWRTSLDHIGSTGTDYLVKMLIYLSLIEIYRERTIDSKIASTVHCILDETGVLAPKYVSSVLQYAKQRGIILITAGHSQQTLGFENWMLVRKCGRRFAAQTVLRKILKCD